MSLSDSLGRFWINSISVESLSSDIQHTQKQQAKCDFSKAGHFSYLRPKKMDQKSKSQILRQEIGDSFKG